MKIAWLKQQQCVPRSFRSYLWVPIVVDVCSVGELVLRLQGLGMGRMLRPRKHVLRVTQELLNWAVVGEGFDAFWLVGTSCKRIY